MKTRARHLSFGSILLSPLVAYLIVVIVRSAERWAPVAVFNDAIRHPYRLLAGSHLWAAWLAVSVILWLLLARR